MGKAKTAGSQRFHIEETDKALIISWRWFSQGTIGLVLFAALWNGIVWALDVALLSMLHQLDLYPILVIPVLLTLLGLLLLYGVLLRVFNKTTMVVSDNKLVTRTGPIPVAGGNKTFYSDYIEQVYVRELAYRTGRKNREVPTYDLMILFYGDRKPRTLIFGLEHIVEARYLERQIETYLGIRNREVVEDGQSVKKRA